MGFAVLRETQLARWRLHADEPLDALQSECDARKARASFRWAAPLEIEAPRVGHGLQLRALDGRVRMTSNGPV